MIAKEIQVLIMLRVLIKRLLSSIIIIQPLNLVVTLKELETLILVKTLNKTLSNVYSRP